MKNMKEGKMDKDRKETKLISSSSAKEDERHFNKSPFIKKKGGGRTIGEGGVIH